MVKLSFKCSSIKISLLFLGVLALMILSFGRSQVFNMMAACAIHELGHLCYLIFTRKPFNLCANYYGLKLCTDSSEMSYVSEGIFITLGPLFNLVVSISLFSFGVCFELAFANFLIGLLSILPIFPMDGGRVLEIISLIIFKETFAKVLCKTISIVFSSIFLFFALYTCFFGKFNITLLLLSVYLVGVNIAK